MRRMVILIIIALLGSGMGHPFFLSVTDLKYNPSEKRIQGSVKIFTNDLEDALRRINKQTVDLIHPKDTTLVQQQLRLYLLSHLGLEVNGKRVEYETLGFEQEQEATWIYIESAACSKPTEITVTNRVLYDFIKEQANIVHMEVSGERKSQKVNAPEEKLHFRF